MSKFVLRRVDTGYKFDLFAANGQTVAASEVYETLAACRKGMESVRKNAPAAHLEDGTAPDSRQVSNPKFQIFQDRAGRFRFRLTARNGKVVAVSDGYSTKAGCENGIRSVRENAPVAEIEELPEV